LPRFIHHVSGIVAGTAVYPQAHRHTSFNHFSNGRNATGQAHIAARAMGNARARGCKQRDAFIVQLDAMGMPHIVSQPTQVFCILRGCSIEFFQAVGNVVVVFCQVGV